MALCRFHKRMNRLADWILAASVERATKEGGFPDDVRVVGDHLAIATLSTFDGDTAPRLMVYGPEECMDWYKGVRHSIHDEPDESILYHVREGMPSVREP